MTQGVGRIVLWPLFMMIAALLIGSGATRSLTLAEESSADSAGGEARDSPAVSAQEPSVSASESADLSRTDVHERGVGRSSPMRILPKPQLRPILTPIQPWMPSKGRVEYDRLIPPGSRQQKPFPPPPPPVIRISPDGTVGGVRQDPLTALTGTRWVPGTTLRVHMAGGTSRVRSKVMQLAEEWTRYAYIRFMFVDDPQVAEIRIDFEKDGFSWSLIGTNALLVASPAITMHFGWFEDETLDSEFSRVVLHEFGHALGLVHEHQSPVAGIPWNKEQVYADMAKATPPWDRAKVDANLFIQYSKTSTNYSQYDPTSIMQYSYPASWTLDRKEILGNWTLSLLDKDTIRRWYPFPPSQLSSLHTGDDCDRIMSTVAYGMVPDDKVRFELRPGPGITWWKSIRIPAVNAPFVVVLEMQDGQTASQDIPLQMLNKALPISFGKAKFFGTHTMLNYTWPVLPALPGGSRLTLEWVNDRCR